MLRSYEAESPRVQARRSSCWSRRSTRRSATRSANSYEKAIRDLEVARAQGAPGRHRPVRGVPPALPRRPRVHARRDVPPGRALLRAQRRRPRRGDARLRGAAQDARTRRADADAAARAAGRLRQSIALYQQLIDEVPRLPAQRRAPTTCSATAWRSRTSSTSAQDAYQRRSSSRYPKSQVRHRGLGAHRRVLLRRATTTRTRWPRRPRPTRHAVAGHQSTRSTTRRSTSSAGPTTGWTASTTRCSRFLALVDYYDGPRPRRRATRGRRRPAREALQYTAISFADEKWGSLAKAQEIFAKLGGRPYEAEIYRRMGDVYFDQTKHPDAIEAYRLVLQKDPLAKDAPQIQQKIVQAYERDRKLDEAFAESRAAGQHATAPGTPWYEKHKSDPDVLAAAAGAGREEPLLDAPSTTTSRRWRSSRRASSRQARATFETAAKAYGDYLERFPRCKNAYEMQFYLRRVPLQLAPVRRGGQALRRGARLAAGRRSTRQDAAFAAVLAWQKQLELEQLKDEDARRAQGAPQSTERPEGEKPKRHPAAPSREALVAASDAFLAAAPRTTTGARHRLQGRRAASTRTTTSTRRASASRRSSRRTRRTRSPSTPPTSSSRPSSSTRTGRRSKRSPTRLAPEQGRHRPEERPLQGPGQVQAGRPLQARRRADGQGRATTRRRRSTSSWSTKSPSTSSPTRRSTTPRSATRTTAGSTRRSSSTSASSASTRTQQAGRRGAVPRRGERRELVRLRQGGRELPAAGEGLPGLARTARTRCSTPPACSKGCSATTRPPPPTCATPTCSPRREDAPKNQFRAALIYEKQNDCKNEIGALQEFVRSFGSKADAGRAGGRRQEAHRRRATPKLEQREATRRRPTRPPPTSSTAAASSRTTRPIAADAAAESPLPAGRVRVRRVRQAEDRRRAARRSRRASPPSAPR